ncbi:MAG: DUF2059 domain-containing protein [Cyanosarcina radialis HA8281-LM2]|jgi:hypothetical protein|nr:DUF2059 domain-containing protein [Cyanosarcina radialis HA8281-LM2]
MFESIVKPSVLLLTLCILLASCAVDPQQETSPEVGLETVVTSQSKKELAREVLLEIGIAKRYNLYLSNSIDLGLADTSSHAKLREWLHEIMVREAGWAKIEEQYVARLEADFSESELQELLKLAKQPVMKKLLQNEIQSYSDSSKARQKLLFQVWDDYSSGRINPPKEVLP